MPTWHIPRVSRRVAGGGWRRPEYICQLQDRGLQTEREYRGEGSSGQTCRITPRQAVRPARPPVLYLAFLHLISFLLFLPALGSLLRGFLQQGVLPLPRPHLLQGQGTGPVSSATLQPAPSPGDRPSTGAATASPKSPSIRADGSPGAEPTGRAFSRQPGAAKAKWAPERGGVSASGDPERSPSARREERAPGTAGHRYLLVLLFAQRER